MTMTEEYITGEEYFSALRDYRRQVEESDGFDIENISISPSLAVNVTGGNGLSSYNCKKYCPHRALVNLYAKAGLHRYNMLEETSFELDALIKVNMTNELCVRVDEQRYGSLDMTVSIARPKEDQGEVTTITKTPFISHFHGEAKAEGCFKGDLPLWPQDFSDPKRFYVLEKPEWEATDWISLYLELVICATVRSIVQASALSGLEILKVAIETIEDVEPSSERLKAKSANVYITFKGLAKAPRMVEVGEHVERKAIVRRVLDEHSGYLTLLGKLWSGEKALHNNRSSKKRSRDQIIN